MIIKKPYIDLTSGKRVLFGCDECEHDITNDIHNKPSVVCTEYNSDNFEVLKYCSYKCLFNNIHKIDIDKYYIELPKINKDNKTEYIKEFK